MFEQGVLLGEDFPHKVSAGFDNHSAAEEAAWSLVHKAGLPPSQIRVVRPDDTHMETKVEPETRGVARTLLKTHIVLGLGALVVGLVTAAVLVTVGPVLTRSSPVMTFIALGFLFPALGLMLAGAISLRPDHDPLIEKTRSASETGRWTVIAHCADNDEKSLAKATMDYSAQTL